ncbi:MAG: hypothetical protein ACLQVF_04200 [Isosphaeraceae bacterium]
MRDSRNKNQAAVTDVSTMAAWGTANFDNDAAMEKVRAEAEEFVRRHPALHHLAIPYYSSDGEDRSATLFEVDRIELRSPAIWLAVAPDHWSTICWLATRHGWTLPRPASELSLKSEWTFEVRGDSAIKLSVILEIMGKSYTDRFLRELFGQSGWKDKLGSLASFFASRGVAIFVCRSKGQFEGADA